MVNVFAIVFAERLEWRTSDPVHDARLDRREISEAEWNTVVVPTGIGGCSSSIFIRGADFGLENIELGVPLTLQALLEGLAEASGRAKIPGLPFDGRLFECGHLQVGKKRVPILSLKPPGWSSYCAVQ